MRDCTYAPIEESASTRIFLFIFKFFNWFWLIYAEKVEKCTLLICNKNITLTSFSDSFSRILSTQLITCLIWKWKWLNACMRLYEYVSVFLWFCNTVYIFFYVCLLNSWPRSCANTYIYICLQGVDQILHDILLVDRVRQVSKHLLGHIGPIDPFGGEMGLGNVKINNFRTFLVVVLSNDISSFLARWKDIELY